MAERSNAAVSKTVVRLTVDRGFESPSLRQIKAARCVAFLVKEHESLPALSEMQIKII